MKKQIFIFMIVGLFIFPLVNADIIIPTVTKVYFEQNGQPYEGIIEFTIKGYGYATGMPGIPGYNANQEPGTYTPKVVYSFSATYNEYGGEIYENYYRNYLHIDYYELEGKTEDGRTFIIKNIESIPTNCVDINPEDNEEYQSCIANLTEPNFIDPYTQSAGSVREDYLGRNWTKGEDGMWSTQNTHIVEHIICQEDNSTKPSPDAFIKSSTTYNTHTSFEDSDDYEVGEKRTDSDGNVWTKENDAGSWYREVTTTCFGVNKTEKVSTKWGDMMWHETDKEMYAYNEAKNQCEEILDNIYSNEDYYAQKCELRFNLDDADWNFTPPAKGFWGKIKCFFISLFGGSC